MTTLGCCFVLTLLGATTPETIARDFVATYLQQDKAIGHFQGVQPLRPFLSKRLTRVLSDAVACAKDWRRQQPPGSTDKPPFVDCCLFASSPEGIPTRFGLGATERLPDGRYQIAIDYTFTDPPGTYADRSIPLETWSWRDAVIVAYTHGQYRVDDFVFLRDSPESPLLLSESFTGCRGRHWIGQRAPSNNEMKLTKPAER